LAGGALLFRRIYFVLLGLDWGGRRGSAVLILPLRQVSIIFASTSSPEDFFSALVLTDHAVARPVFYHRVLPGESGAVTPAHRRPGRGFSCGRKVTEGERNRAQASNKQPMIQQAGAAYAQAQASGLCVSVVPRN